MRKNGYAAAMAASLVVLLASPAAGQLFGGAGELEVVDFGAEPRQLLRYEFEEGQTETMRMSMATTWAVSMDGSPVMDMEIPVLTEVEFAVTEVLPDGSARMELTFTAFDVGDVRMDTEAAPAEVAEAARASVQDLVGITGWQVVDPLGAVQAFGLDMPEAFPAELRSQFSTSAGMGQQRLPEEPVGVGARWLSEMEIESGGLPMQFMAETEVVALDPDGVTLVMTLAADADLASAMLAELPADIDIEVGRFDMDGAGETRIVFGQLTPEGDIDLAAGFDMSISGEEDGVPKSMRMSMEMDMRMTVERID